MWLFYAEWRLISHKKKSVSVNRQFWRKSQLVWKGSRSSITLIMPLTKTFTRGVKKAEIRSISQEIRQSCRVYKSLYQLWHSLFTLYSRVENCVIFYAWRLNFWAVLRLNVNHIETCQLVGKIYSLINIWKYPIECRVLIISILVGVCYRPLHSQLFGVLRWICRQNFAPAI